MKAPKFLMRIPADKHGDRFLEDIRTYLNKGGYKVRVRFSGKKRTAWGDTNKKNAEYYRVYVQDRNPDSYYPMTEGEIARDRNRQADYTNKLSEIKALADRALGIIHDANTER